MDIELSDAELVRQIGSGNDREAEAELFRRMAPRVRLYGLNPVSPKRDRPSVSPSRIALPSLGVRIAAIYRAHQSINGTDVLRQSS
jgi:hypothetical protein